MRDDIASHVLRVDGSVADRAAVLAEDIRAHGDAVRRVASVCCGVDRASDVAQEVFLRFWLNPERFDPTRGSLRTYLLMVGRSAAIDAARSDTARRRREEAELRREGLPRESIDDGLVRDEAAERVRSALRRLPRLEREAIATAFYGGCSYRAAAIVLGESEGTVKSRIRAGLRRLRELLDDQAVIVLEGVASPTP